MLRVPGYPSLQKQLNHKVGALALGHFKVDRWSEESVGALSARPTSRRLGLPELEREALPARTFTIWFLAWVRYRAV